MTRKKIIYIHGKGGNSSESEQYKNFFDCEIVGIDYNEYRAWLAKEIILKKYLEIKTTCSEFEIIANSIGAYFAMLAFENEQNSIKRAYFISPIVDMEKIIINMMSRAGVSEEDLKTKGEIEIDFGEKLSWEYLKFVREYPLKWNVPTEILYGSEDFLTSFETIQAFSESHNCYLTVMNGGEHWFHTPEQMNFLTQWLKSLKNKKGELLKNSPQNF